MLSFISLNPESWEEHSYVSCCGTSIQPVQKVLERAPQLNKVFLCLDNDEAGHLACRRMENELSGRVYVERMLPTLKDWNDDLIAEKEMEVSQTCQISGLSL